MRSASPTISTTIPISVAITKYAGPVTGCAENTACPSSSPVGTRASATLSISRTERHQLQGTAESRHRPADTRILQPGRFACPLAAGRIRDQARKVYLRQAPDQERFTRLKTLGADYKEEAVVSRIAGGPRPSRQPQQRSGTVSLLIDIQNNIKAQQSAGYQRWATIENLKRAAAP